MGNTTHNTARQETLSTCVGFASIGAMVNWGIGTTVRADTESMVLRPAFLAWLPHNFMPSMMRLG